MNKEELKRLIKQTLTENPDKKITPQELEDAMIAIVDKMSEGGADDKQDKIEDLEEIREGAKLGATALQEYYDDGSGEVVPVKHPDLSTQPSILPYKFAGNYVYEQMVYVDLGTIRGEWIKDILELPDDFLILELVGQVQKGGETVILPLIGGGNLPSMNLHIDDKSIVFTGLVSMDGTSMPVSAWFRVVWTTKPKAADEYYYQQGGNEATLELAAGGSTIATYPMTLKINGREFDWIAENGHITLYGDLLNRFLSGEAAITMKRGSSDLREIMFHNNETNERDNMFVYPEDTFTVDNLAALAPQTYSNLKKGISQRLYLNTE